MITGIPQEMTGGVEKSKKLAKETMKKKDKNNCWLVWESCVFVKNSNTDNKVKIHIFENCILKKKVAAFPRA
ncbi:hypothetical protein ACISMS_08845, partial [Campylobacter jejuni]